MRIKPARQPGHVVFDIDAGDVALLRSGDVAPEFVSTVVEEENAYLEEIHHRANRRTQLLDEILARSRTLASLSIEKAKLG
jgi:predicted metal-dependent HD superfamily phosphohydrolase